MINIVIELLILFFLLVINGLFSMSEIAIVSVRKAHLQQLADSGDDQAKVVLEVASHPDRFLATVQIGITLVGTLAGAFGGATLALKLSPVLAYFPVLAPYRDTLSVAIIVLLITYFTLVIGELVPKQLGLNHAEAISRTMSRPMQYLSLLTAPFVWFLTLSSQLVLKLLRVKPASEPSVTPEEIKVLIEQGTESGTIEMREQEMIEGILRLDERRISAFMTPRTKIVAFDREDSAEEIYQKLRDHRYSQYPVIQNNLDKVLGVVHSKDILAQLLSQQPIDLQQLLTPPLFVPESISALQLLNLISEKGTHIALITNEYGGIQGMVTHNDILEDIAGYTPPQQLAKPLYTRREDGSWLLDGLLDIDEMKELLDIDKLPEEEYGHYHTLGGFLMSELGTIPVVGQKYQWNERVFEIVDMDGYRVDKVLVFQHLLK